MEVKNGCEQLPFEAALDAEPERLLNDSDYEYEDGARFKYNELHFGYLKKGRYREYLEPWYEAFDRDKILVMESEAFFAQTDAAMQTVHQFLSLCEHPLQKYDTFYKGNYEPMNEKARTRLQAYFQPHNVQLYKLIGRRFNW
jgi:hypothetical protein